MVENPNSSNRQQISKIVNPSSSVGSFSTFLSNRFEVQTAPRRRRHWPRACVVGPDGCQNQNALRTGLSSSALSSTYLFNINLWCYVIESEMKWELFKKSCQFRTKNFRQHGDNIRAAIHFEDQEFAMFTSGIENLVLSFTDNEGEATNICLVHIDSHGKLNIPIQFS